MSNPPSMVLSIRLDQELSRLEGEIRWYEEEALKGAKFTVLNKIEVGKRLLDAKRVLSGRGVPQGAFGQWVQARFGWTRTWTAAHMRLARADVKCSLHRLTGAQSMNAALAALKAEPVEKPRLPGGTASVIRYRLSGVVELPADRERTLAELIEACTAADGWRVKWKVVAVVEDQPEQPTEEAA